MIITCPQCATQYNLSDSAVRHGAKARCAQCKTIFVLHVQVQAQGPMQSQGHSPTQAQPQQAYIQAHNQSQIPEQSQQYIQSQLAPQVQVHQMQTTQRPIVTDGLPPLSPPPSPASSMDSALGGPAFMQGDALRTEGLSLGQLAGDSRGYNGVHSHATEYLATQHASAPQSPQSSYFHPAQNSTLTGQANLAQRPCQVDSYTQSATGPDATSENENSSTPFQSFMTGLLLLIIFGMLGYGAWRYMPRLGNDQLEAEASRIAHVSDQIKDISLHNVRQYTVQSAKAGLLLVLEGRVINNFRSPREMVKIEAALYDKAGNRLESTQQLCGILVSKLQMQIWDASEIEAALDNELEAYAHNVNIASGTSVPFMVVFVNPPASVVSYGVHVVDAQIPPSK